MGQKGGERDVAAELSHQRHPRLICCVQRINLGVIRGARARGEGGRELGNTSVPLPVISNFIFTSADEISSCSITIHRLAFPDFMHQNALIYRVTLSLTLAPKVLLLSVGTEACPGAAQGLISWRSGLRRQCLRGGLQASQGAMWAGCAWGSRCSGAVGAATCQH